MTAGARWAVGAAGALLLVVGAGARSAAGELRLGLPEAVRRARAQSHLVRAGSHDVERAEAGVRRARAQRILPEAKLTAGTGLVPEARGTLLDSPDDSSDLDGLGPYYRVELRLVQPLWTFGRLDALEGLAREGLAAERAKRELTLQSVGLDAARAYLGLAAAARGEATAGEMQRDFDKLLAEVEQRLADESSGVDDADLLEVKANAYTIERARLDAREGREAAQDALRALLALDPAEDPVALGEAVPAFAAGAEAERGVGERAVAAHREVLAIEQAVRVLEARAGLQRASRNPVLFLGAGLGWAHAGNRDPQDNPWANEDFNYRRIGAEVGLAFDLNLHRQNLEVRETEAERRSLLEKLAALRARVGLEARRSLREAVRNRALLESARGSLKAAKSRLRLTLDNWESGLGEVGDALDAYETYYRLKAEEPQREYELGLSLARLAAALGDVNLFLEWVERGRVAL